MAFLDKTGLQTLTNKLVQGDAIKVASHRGKNVKEVIDNIQRECENVALPNTMTLENRVSEFKVGKGRDVDVSGDVEEGKINVELQGKTYQNLIKENQSYTKDLVTTNHTGFLFPKYDLKSNVTYTIMFNVSNLVKDGNDSVYCIFRGNNDSNVFIQFDAFYVEKNGVFAQKFTLANGLKNFLIGVSGSSNKNNPSFTIGDIMILEGDYTQTPTEELPSYFEGIKSSFKDGIVDVEVQGKNLFDGQLRTFNTNDTYIDNIGQHHNGDNNIPIKPNTSYTMTFETISGDSNIYIWNGNEKVLTIPSGKDTVSFRTPLECNSLSFYRSVADYTKDRLKYKIQLEENSKSTSYEPYYKKKISFNIGEPLRSLPNGVCDEIKNNNGQWELVRRIGKVVLDGSSSTEYAYLTHEKTLRFSIFIRAELELLKPKTASHGICDRIPYMYGNSDDVFHCRFDGSSPYGNLIIWIEKSKLESENPTGLKKWLQSNPTTFYYQLAEPTITPIEPIEFNISQGSTINISSDITPTSTHKVILNRAGQIEQGIELIANLKSRVNELENIYDSNLIATQYKLDNLKLNYELEREED